MKFKDQKWRKISENALSGGISDAKGKISVAFGRGTRQAGCPVRGVA
jgi:hypothetical protein